MKIFEHESYKCTDCKKSFTDPSDVKDWKCPYCNKTIWILAVVDGNQRILERIKAKDIQKGDVILFGEDSEGCDVKKIKRFGNKVKIYLKGQGVVNEKPGIFLNTITGAWQPIDES